MSVPSFPWQAMWFTEEAGPEGAVFGNVDMWKGLGVILDSFDNDGLVRTSVGGGNGSPTIPPSLQPSLVPSLQHDNPKIQVVVNDGTMKYEHARCELTRHNNNDPSSCFDFFCIHTNTRTLTHAQ